MSALLQFIPDTYERLRRLPWGAVATLLAGSFLALTPLVLGTGLNEGFLSAYGALPIAMAVVVLSLGCIRSELPWLFVLLGIGTFVVFFSWTMLAVVPATATLLAGSILLWRQLGKRVHRNESGETRRTMFEILISWGIIIIVLGGVFLQRHVLESQLAQNGAIWPISHTVLILITLFALGWALALQGSLRSNLYGVPAACGTSGILVVVWINTLAPHASSWTYYAMKTDWLVVSCLAWVLFAPVLQLAIQIDERSGTSKIGIASGLIQFAAFSSLIFIALGATTTLPSPIKLAFAGWNQPTAQGITVVQHAGNASGPFVIWNVEDVGNDRLSNFWGALVWATDKAGEPKLGKVGPYDDFQACGYLATPILSSLCETTGFASPMKVYTADSKLKAQLSSTCPGRGLETILVNPKTK